MFRQGKGGNTWVGWLEFTSVMIKDCNLAIHDQEEKEKSWKVDAMYGKESSVGKKIIHNTNLKDGRVWSILLDYQQRFMEIL